MAEKIKAIYELVDEMSGDLKKINAQMETFDKETKSNAKGMQNLTKYINAGTVSITALVVAGRVGAAIAAEIGTMQVTEQIDALHTLAYSPIKYLVVPRFLALMLMLPLLTIYSDLIGIFGGYTICIYKLGITSGMYLNIAFDSLVYKDFFTGLLKSVTFGMIIAISSCYQGLSVSGGAEGVGRATTNAVVNSFILIIVADCFITAIFYFIFP